MATDWDEPRENGLMPHREMYRQIVSDTLDEEAVERIAHGPSFKVLPSRPPSDTVPKPSTVPMMAGYQMDMAVRSTPHVIAAEPRTAWAEIQAKPPEAQTTTPTTTPPTPRTEGYSGPPFGSAIRPWVALATRCDGRSRERRVDPRACGGAVSPCTQP